MLDEELSGLHRNLMHQQKEWRACCNRKRILELFEKEQKDTEDDDLHFFKSMLLYMKKLLGTKRLRVRSQMQNLLLQELEQLEN